MKFASLFIALFLLCAIATAQNMVPNGDFEDYITCPSTNSQVSNCIGWRSYHAGTIDYFNACAVTTVSVPFNANGRQSPARGYGYMGGYNYFTIPSLFNYKEYLTRTIDPLTIGRKYEVSISVSLADNAAFGTDDLGVLFYDRGPAATAPNYWVLTTPQISYASYGVLMDTANWVRLTKTFIADSAYDNIVIGGFSNYNTINTMPTGNTGTAYSFYYIDSVVVKPIYNLFANLIDDTTVCAGNQVSVAYNVIPTFTLAPGNIFTVQLSDISGSFAAPVTIGTLTGTAYSGIIPCTIPLGLNGSGFRIRIKSSNQLDSSNNTPSFTILSLQANAGKDTTLCAGDTLLLAATTIQLGLAFTWSGPSFAASGQNHKLPHATAAMAGSYIVTATYNDLCPVKDTIQVTVKPIPTGGSITGSSPICAGNSLLLSATTPATGVSFSWNGPGGFIATGDTLRIPYADSTMTGFYKVTYTLNGCSISDSVKATIYRMPSPITATANTPLCEGETLQLSCTSPDAGIIYKWAGPAFTASQQNPQRTNAGSSMAGQYTVTTSYGTTCIQSAIVDVIVNPQPKNLTTEVNTPVCIGDTLRLFAGTTSPGVSFKWDGPAGFTTTDSVAYLYNAKEVNTGTYTLTAAIDMCRDVKNVNVEVLNLQLELGADALLCNGETKLLTASIPTATYTWQDNSTDSFFTVRAPGTYTLIANTACGTLNDAVNISYQECDCRPFIPSAFTPNGDGLNDAIHPKLSCITKAYTFIIVNRFGQQVFSSDNPAQKWDGMFKGEQADVGTYFYVLKLTAPRGDQHLFKGDITLIR